MELRSNKKRKSETIPSVEMSETIPSVIFSHPKGFKIEELVKGKPDGKKAVPGAQVGIVTGAGPVPSLLLSEICPGRLRATALAVCLAVHWVINFFVGLLFLRMLEQLGSVLLNTIFGFFCVVAVIFVQKNVIETKGKSLQEIEITLLSSTQ